MMARRFPGISGNAAPKDTYRRYLWNVLAALILPAVGYLLTWLAFWLRISDEALFWIGVSSLFLGIYLSIAALIHARSLFQVFIAVLALLVAIGFLVWVALLMLLWFKSNMH